VLTNNLDEMDIDSNGYPDIVVSAPSSDLIVILRTRSIVEITRSFTLIPPTIDLLACASKDKQPCTAVRLCMSGKHRTSGNNNFSELLKSF